MSRIALNHTLKVKAALPAVQVHALRHASSSTSGSSTPSPSPSPLASTSSTPRSEIPDATINARKSRTTHFGFREIPEEDKETMVGSVFSSVASSYDVMNDTMSLGIHRLWKDNFVSSLLPRLPPSYHESPSRSGIESKSRPPFKCLDVAGGTGDIALRILDRARDKFSCRDIEVEVVDLNQGMLDEGKKRVAKTLYYNTPQIQFTHGNAQDLPKHVESNSIDLYTIAFGIRNCTSLPAVLSEAYRVLKPGGKIGVLEFGKVTNPLFREVYRQYSFQFIPLMGKIIAGDSDSYQYLIESIEKFPSQPDFARLVQEAGFKTGQMREGKGGAWTNYTGGIATAWTGVKV